MLCLFLFLFFNCKSHLVVSVHLQTNVCVKIGAWLTYCFSAKTVDHGHGREIKLYWRLKLKVLRRLLCAMCSSWMSVGDLKVQHKPIRVLHSVYVTHKLFALSVYRLRWERHVSETFILLLDHEHSHTKVHVFPITLMGTRKSCFQIISSTPAASCQHHQSSR